MQLALNIISVLRRVALFALVLLVLAVVARVEPNPPDENESAPVNISKPVAPGWIKALGWRRV